MPPKKKVEIETTETYPQVEFSDMMQRDYIDYAINVIVDRALPDVRDGLKPVQRRVLWDLYDLRVLPDKPYKKCARIVGDTLGRWHPHGESSVYGALVHMAQDWKLTNVLIDGHGNFGSLDGDPEAAMRYTECRLSPLGLSMIESISPDVVEFKDNYTSEEREPTILPCLFPNLFLNGTEGIAVGMRSEIPTHNLGELIDAILAYMKKPKITTEELLEIIPGPDYPTGATIINKNELLELYKTGVGKIIIRAKIETEKGENGRTNLVVTEIPYTLSGQKEKLKDNLISLMKDKKLEEVADLRDESDAEGVRIVLEVKKGVDIPNLINKLYKKSRLQDTEACNFLVVNGQSPKQVGLKAYFEEFITFQEDIYTKKYKALLEKALHRQEMNNGLLLAFDMVDVIIETIRNAKNVATAKECLMTGNTKDIAFKTKKSASVANTFKFTEVQAQYIEMFRAKEIPVVLLPYAIDTHFISFIEFKNNDVKFKRIDSAVAENTEKSTEINALINKFKDAIGDENLKVECANLENTKLPAILNLSEESRRMQEMSAMRMGKIGDIPEDITVVLNLTSPIVTKLSSSNDTEFITLVSNYIYDIATLAHRPLTSDRMTAFIERSNEILSKI